MAESAVQKSDNENSGEESGESASMDDSVKNCVEEFTNEIIIYMQNNQNTELGMSKDNPPQQLYKWIYKKDAQTIIKKGISANGKVQVIDTYKKNITFETAKIPKDYTETFVSTDLETTTIEGKEYCKFIIENKVYYVSKNFVDQNKKNLLEEFNSKCISVNLKKNAISNNEVCPEGKLIITKENINKFKQNLIDKLSEENEDLIQYVTPVDGTEDYNIYNEKKNFYELLSKYLKRTISKHPIEWDFNKIKQDKVCETRGKAPIDENKCCDIAAGLKTADPKIFGKNSFYFVCAPYFYNKMDELGLLEFNPYEGMSFTYEWGYLKQNNKEKENRTQIVESNPGFVPGKYSGDKFFPCAPNGLFRERYPSKNTTNPYPHEGVDFEASYGTGVYATICGIVLAIKDQKDKHYGYHVLIHSDDGYIFLLGHLSSICVEINQRITPNTLVAKVGNSGNCYTSGHKLTPDERAKQLGAHLHLSVFKGKQIKDIYNAKEDSYTYSEKLVNPFHREHNWKKDIL